MNESKKAVLRRLGYRVQDMEAKFGANAYQGRWRWVHLPSGHHQDDSVHARSENDAWRLADEHACAISSSPKAISA